MGEQMDWSDWGDLGITYGALAGALLNFLLLGITIWLAVWHQPRSQKRSAETLEASRVIAWPAETYAPTTTDDAERADDEEGLEPAYHGVVIANTSASTARNVDLKLSTRRQSQAAQDRTRPEFSTIAGNRELILPPGTWFIPIQRNEAKNVDEWKLPIPVDTDGKLQVSMQGDQVFDLRTQQLRDQEHRPPVAGAAIGIGFLRFTLGPRSWWRDGSGGLRPSSHLRRFGRGARAASAVFKELPRWEEEFRLSEVKGRGAATESNEAARVVNKQLADRIEREFRKKGHWAERNQGTGVHLRLGDAPGPYIRLAGSGSRYPDSLTVIDEQAKDKELSRLVFDSVLEALPSDYSRQIHLRNKTAEFWQEGANFSLLMKALGTGASVLERAVHARQAPSQGPRQHLPG